MPNGYFENYIPVVTHAVIVFGLAVIMVVLSWALGQRKRSRVKMMPYECGMEPTGDARQRFSIRFYLVAMIFILLDFSMPVWR